MKKVFCFLFLVFASLSFAAFDEASFFDEIQKSDSSQKLSDAIKCLKAQKHFELEAEDAQARPLFVFFQAEVEKILTKYLEEKKIHDLIGVIHTKAPATPLCSLGEISEGLVAPQMEKDLIRLKTVTTRAKIIRDYLDKGGVLYAAFTKDGFNMRTEDQQKIFQDTLLLYPRYLTSYELSCENIPYRLNGATYLFKSDENQLYLFSIMAPQALFAKEDQKWTLWFGELANKKIYERYYEVTSFLDQNNGPNLFKFLEKS